MEVQEVLRLVEEGRNDCEIARLTGIPLSTVRHWRVADRRAHAATGCATCGHPAHDFARLPTAPYAYLLGIYLGDGHITSGARDVKRLQVCCDAKYTEIAATIADAIGAVIGRPGSIRRHARARMLYVSSYSKQWPCLLPQHGVGRKHERPIVLAPWQQAHVEAHPDQLIRGLIHSDGTRCLNKVRAQGRSYAYPRYMFSNASHDIRRIFCEACDRLGVAWRPMTAHVISIAKRDSVALVDEFIEPKR